MSGAKQNTEQDALNQSRHPALTGHKNNIICKPANMTAGFFIAATKQPVKTQRTSAPNGHCSLV
jgi:hypothetical protein